MSVFAFQQRIRRKKYIRLFRRRRLYSEVLGRGVVSRYSVYRHWPQRLCTFFFRDGKKRSVEFLAERLFEELEQKLRRRPLRWMCSVRESNLKTDFILQNLRRHLWFERREMNLEQTRLQLLHQRRGSQPALSRRQKKQRDKVRKGRPAGLQRPGREIPREGAPAFPRTPGNSPYSGKGRRKAKRLSPAPTRKALFLSRPKRRGQRFASLGCLKAGATLGRLLGAFFRGAGSIDRFPTQPRRIYGRERRRLVFGRGVMLKGLWLRRFRGQLQLAAALRGRGLRFAGASFFSAGPGIFGLSLSLELSAGRKTALLCPLTGPLTRPVRRKSPADGGVRLRTTADPKHFSRRVPRRARRRVAARKRILGRRRRLRRLWRYLCRLRWNPRRWAALGAAGQAEVRSWVRPLRAALRPIPKKQPRPSLAARWQALCAADRSRRWLRRWMLPSRRRAMRLQRALRKQRREQRQKQPKQPRSHRAIAVATPAPAAAGAPNPGGEGSAEPTKRPRKQRRRELRAAARGEVYEEKAKAIVTRYHNRRELRWFRPLLDATRFYAPRHRWQPSLVRWKRSLRLATREQLLRQASYPRLRRRMLRRPFAGGALGKALGLYTLARGERPLRRSRWRCRHTATIRYQLEQMRVIAEDGAEGRYLLVQRHYGRVSRHRLLEDYFRLLTPEHRLISIQAGRNKYLRYLRYVTKPRAPRWERENVLFRWLREDALKNEEYNSLLRNSERKPDPKPRPRLRPRRSNRLLEPFGRRLPAEFQDFTDLSEAILERYNDYNDRVYGRRYTTHYRWQGDYDRLFGEDSEKLQN